MHMFYNQINLYLLQMNHTLCIMICSLLYASKTRLYILHECPDSLVLRLHARVTDIYADMQFATLSCPGSKKLKRKKIDMYELIGRPRNNVIFL